MKRIFKFIILFIISFSSLTFVKTLNAETPVDLEFWIVGPNGEETMTVAEFNNYISTSYYVELKVMVKSVSTPVSLGGYHFVFQDDGELKYQNEEKNLFVYEYQDGPFTKTVELMNITAAGYNVIGSLSTSRDESAYMIPTEGVELYSFWLSTQDWTTTDLDYLILDFTSDAGNYSGAQLTSTTKPFIIGEEPVAQSTDFNNLEIKGDSGTSYFNSALSDSSVTNDLYISYADSLKPLTFIEDLESNSATVDVTGEVPPILDGSTIGITITDGEVGSQITETYNFNIHVTPAKTANSLSNLTVNSGDITPAFDPNTTEYTLNLDYAESTATINAYVDPADLSTLNKSTISKTFGVGTTTETFIVTAEDGTPKTYTINVVRAAASTDTELSGITVNGVSAGYDGT
ncbi:MAG: cadherin-like beta sandwich domain-containing protein, partial [Candidatus Izemoplasmatales bacterium]